MDLRHAHDTLATALAPATVELGRRRTAIAFRFGLNHGVRAMPRFAAVLALGWFGASYVAGAPLFSPWALPGIVLLTPLAAGLAYRSAAHRSGAIDPRSAALVVDRNNQNKDRLTTALEFADAPETAGADRHGALARIAVEDGVATLARVDLDRTALPEPRLHWSLASAMLAVVICLLPAVLPLGTGAKSTPEAPPTTTADAGPVAGDGTEPREPAAEPSPSATEPRTVERPAAAERTARPREPEPKSEPPAESPTPPRQPSGAGAGAATAEPTGASGRRAPTAGDAKTANNGATSTTGQGGGGQGAAKSETPNEPEREPTPRDPKTGTSPPKRPSETEGGEQEKSSGNPSGPARGGGRMAAVGNQRSGMERGRDRDDDPDTDDEDVEDEKEETEQRGGVMPMTRDRMRAAARELSISGNGPPGDGRGGPTPPKKSRGTASLVLGIRLPDQIRGQPNPGTAKTTIEQIPPVPGAEAPRPATPAPSTAPSPNVQSPAADAGAFADAVRRYHELLRVGTADPSPKHE